jgi:hypothetical protein
MAHRSYAGTITAAATFQGARNCIMYFNRDRRIAHAPVESGPSVLALLLISLAIAAVTVVTIWTVLFASLSPPRTGWSGSSRLSQLRTGLAAVQ